MKMIGELCTYSHSYIDVPMAEKRGRMDSYSALVYEL